VGDSSWLSGPPEDGGRLLELLKAAKRDGVQRVEVDPATDLAFFNPSGVTALASFAELPRTPSYDLAALGPRDLFITRRVVEPGAPPSALLKDGSGLYMTLGNPVKPLAEYDPRPGR
jgi:hypothetical protein